MSLQCTQHQLHKIIRRVGGGGGRGEGTIHTCYQILEAIKRQNQRLKFLNMIIVTMNLILP